METTQLESYLAFAVKTALGAGQILLKQKRTVTIASYKGNARTDFSTTADIASETFIIDSIRACFPEHNILSEESHNEQQGQQEYRWVIDPLDGTWEYARGGENYATLISFESRLEVLVAVAYFPEREVLVTAQKHAGAFINKRRVKPSTLVHLSQALGLLRMPNNTITNPDLSVFQSIQTSLIRSLLRVKALPADIEAAIHVASGQVDIFVIPSFLSGYTGPKWWDIAAGTLFVKEAGGTVTDWQGEPIRPSCLSNGLVFTNGPLHPTLLSILKKNWKRV